jgi:hypothetical protein
VDVEVRAESDAFTSAPGALRIADAAPFARLDLALERPAPNLAVLRGEVVDALDTPLGNVTVEVVGQPLRAVTDSSGHFRIAKVPLGTQRLTVRRLGFTAVDATIDATAGAIVDKRFVLSRVTTLAGVTTTASTAWIKDFDDHRRLGLGHFLTREDLAKMENNQFSAILATVPGVKLVADSKNPNKKYVTSSRGQRSLSGGTCYAQVFLDEKPLYMGRDGEPLVDINEIIASQAEAVEYFAGPSETPSKYSGLNSGCGVLVIHTRQP